MAQLLVRNVDDAMVTTLRERAARHGLTLVTRKVQHFETLGVRLRNPSSR